MTKKQSDVLRVLVRHRGHRSIRAFVAATTISRATLYRILGGSGRDGSVQTIAKALKVPAREVREIIALGADS